MIQIMEGVMIEATYVLPPECHVFERGDKFLIFDPVSFIWFVTDEIGKAAFEGLSRRGKVSDAIDELSKLSGADFDSVSKYTTKFVKYLQDIEFIHLDSYKPITWGPGVTGGPKVMYLHVTSKCNLKCPYCYNQEHRFQLIQLGRKKDTTERHTEATTEEFFRIVDEAAKLGIDQIKITGGEALLNKDTLLIAKRAKSHKISVNLLTNATIITEEMALRIADSVDSVSISLDSPNPQEHDAVRGKGTHAKVLQAIRMLKQAGVKVIHLNAVVTPVNLNSVTDFLNYAWNELKANEVTLAGAGINVDDPTGRWGAAQYMLTGEQYQQVYKQEQKFYQIQRKDHKPIVPRSSLRRSHCGVGNGVVSVDANGDVYPCQTMHLPEFKCGNVFQDSLEHILETSGVIKKMKSLVVDILPECKVCPMRYICSGGCRQEAYSREGDLLARNRAMCEGYFEQALTKLWESASIPVQNMNEVSEKYQTHYSCH